MKNEQSKQSGSLVEPAVAMPEPLAMRLPEAAKHVGISLSGLYREVRLGRLRACKAGGRTLILRRDLVAWLDSLPAKKLVSQAHRDRMRATWKQRREAEAAARA